jgi:protein-tyrosine phosphatase
MIKVLFICAGNINRSAMADAIFNKMIRERNLSEHFHIDSAATDSNHVGQIPYYGTRNYLKQKNIAYDWIVSRQVTVEDLINFDYITAMDHQNLDKLKKLMQKENRSIDIPLLLDYVPEKKGEEVPDPSITGNYQESFELVELGCKYLLTHILSNHKQV